VDVPTDWKVVRINNKFSFWIPPSVTEVEGRSIDSYSRRWKGDDITINFDYGLFSDPLTLYSRKKSYQITNEKIDNYSARIVSFQRDNGWSFVGVHFPELGKNKFDQIVKLTLVVESGPKIDKEIGSRIVKSISLHQQHLIQ
jgi:uncharacterized protein YijF (DUF1287 family)